MKKEKLVRLTIWVTERQKKTIMGMARKTGETASAIMRQCIEIGMSK